MRISATDFRDLTARLLAQAVDMPSMPSTPDEVRIELCACFASTLDTVSSTLYRLIGQLQFEFEAFDHGTKEQLAVAHMLRDNLGERTTGPLEAGDRWDEAVTVVLGRLGRKSLAWRDLRLHPSQRRVIDSVLRLRSKGLAFTMESGQPQADEAVWLTALARVDAVVASAGGMAVATEHFDAIRRDRRWDGSIGRFLLGQRYGSLSGPARIPFPHGLLLHFCNRHWWDEQKAQSASDLVTAKELIEDLASLSESAWTSPYEYIYVGPEALQEFVAKTTLFDRQYSVEQMSPAHALRIITGLWNDETLSLLLSRVPEARVLVDLAAAVCQGFSEDPSPGWIRRRRLLKELPKSARGMGENLLRKWLLASTTTAVPPLDPLSDSPDSGPPRPLVEVNQQTVWHLPPAVAAIRLVETVHQALCALVPEWRRKEGLALERHLLEEFRGRGVAAVSGRYFVSGQEAGDVDLAVYDERTIVLFEVKRRALTLPAKLGQVGCALRDLTTPLVVAQNQLLRQELCLRNHGELNLMDRNGIAQRIPWNGRLIERYTISMFDYGGLQGREAVRTFLRVALNLRFQSESPELKRRMEDLSQGLDELTMQMQELEVHADRRSDSYFMNVGFVSLPFLYTLLDATSDTASFIEQLVLGAHLDASTRNPYDELCYNRALRRKRDTPT